LKISNIPEKARVIGLGEFLAPDRKDFQPSSSLLTWKKKTA